jgi:uncharacterized membrane protein
MEPKRSKYDTNPLDKDVADRATDSFAASRSATDDFKGGPTRDIGRTANEAARANPDNEAPTRRIDDTVYPSVFAYGQQSRQAAYQPPPVSPNMYQPPPMPIQQVYQPPPMPVGQQAPSSRHVAGLNIPEKWANILPYFPFFIGIIASVIELILVPRSEARTRFHASQGLALQIAIFIIASGLSLIANLTNSGIGSGLFRFGAFVFLIVSIIRVLKGKPHRIAPLEEPAKWLNEKIKPRK